MERPIHVYGTTLKNSCHNRESSCGLCPGNSLALSCIPFLVLSLKYFTTPILFPLGIIHPIPHTFVNSFIFFLGCPTTSGCEERWGQFTHSSQSSSGPENLVFQDTSHLESHSMSIESLFVQLPFYSWGHRPRKGSGLPGGTW